MITRHLSDARSEVRVELRGRPPNETASSALFSASPHGPRYFHIRIRFPSVARPFSEGPKGHARDQAILLAVV